MACNHCNPGTHEVTTLYNAPSKLSSLAAMAVIRLLVYEDYEDCNFYRWDPVIIWQFETHQPKKKKSTKKNVADNIFYGHPPPPWKGVQNLRNWWSDASLNLLGHPVESPLRQLVIDALEKQSWTSLSEEEDILFLLLKLCMDTQLHFATKCINENWFTDLAQIMERLGPFPLQKLIVGNDVFQGNTLLLSTIIQNSPSLQILRIGQWELSNDILFSLANHCPLIQEFSIHGMEPDVFMSDDAFFKCFFNGMAPNEVLECHRKGIPLQVSFNLLKYVDMLFCKQTERLILMLSYFYPNVSLSAFEISSNSSKLVEPFVEANVKMPFLRLCCRTQEILDGKLHSCLRHSSFVKELRLHIDDKFSGAENDSLFHRQLETASLKLKQLLNDVTTIDSLALRPHEGVDITKVLLPMFGAHGNMLRCLYLVYDFSPITVNSLYQLLNLCPLLEKLIIDLNLATKDVSSNSFKTPLREHPTLETLVIQDLETEVDEQETEDWEILSAYCLIIRDLLKQSPNLKNLSMPLMENCNLHHLESLQSPSVERLQLRLSDNYCNRLFFSFLHFFPNLKLLSLQGYSQEIWAECLELLSRKGINVTKKKQEFTNVYPWCDNGSNSNQSVFIMVM